MISKTYANEIDVSKIKIGMNATIQVDAFPENIYVGKVISISNVGEQLANADSKVFEVLIRIDKTDEYLKPAMTSANKIIIETIQDVISIPVNCIKFENDKTLVYTKDKKKQEVILGEMNENYAIVKQGLQENDIIYLNYPIDEN
jgi:hypothetical protein